MGWIVFVSLEWIFGLAKSWQLDGAWYSPTSHFERWMVHGRVLHAP